MYGFIIVFNRLLTATQRARLRMAPGIGPAKSAGLATLDGTRYRPPVDPFSRPP
jgi:hypothetical protein